VDSVKKKTKNEKIRGKKTMKNTIICKEVKLDDIGIIKQRNAAADFVDAFLDSGAVAVEIDYKASGYENGHSARGAIWVAAKRLRASKAIILTERGGRLFAINAILAKSKK
jgi:hypothetical protein